MDPIGGIGWGLCWQEYWHRTKQFSLVAPEGRRAKADQHGNKWSLMNFPRIEGMDEGQKAFWLEVGDALGFDPWNPPKDEAWLLHCQPQKGSYDIACSEIEKAQKAHLLAQRMLAQAQQAQSSAIARQRQDLAVKAAQEVDEWEAEIQASRKKFSECKAVIENAIQRYYLVTLENFQRFDEYQMPLRCHKADVMPQKRHENLPNYAGPQEERLMPVDGMPR